MDVDPLLKKILEKMKDYGDYCPSSLQARIETDYNGEEYWNVTAILPTIPPENRSLNAIFAMSDVLRNHLESSFRDQIGNKKIRLDIRSPEE